MSLPTLSRTWRVSPNNIIPAGVNSDGTADNIWFAVLNAFKGQTPTKSGPLSWQAAIVGGAASAPTNVWTPTSESSGLGGTFGNNDNVERILNISHVEHQSNFNNQQHSWSILKNAGLPNHQLKLVHGATSNATHHVSSTVSRQMSVVGFGAANGGTNGSLTVAPTATDAASIWTQGTGTIPTTSDLATYGSPGVDQHRLHVWATSNGKNWIMVICRNGYTVGMFVVTELDSPLVLPGTPVHTYNGLDEPVAAIFHTTSSAGSGSRSMKNSHWAINQTRFQGFLANKALTTQSTIKRLDITSEGSIQGTPFGYRSGEWSATQEFPIYRAGLQSFDTGFVGRYGILPGMFLGTDTDQGVAEGDNYPNDLSRQFVQFSIWCLPGFNGVFLMT